MDIDKETPLYQAAIECMVSEQTSTTAWERMCTWIRDVPMKATDMKAEFDAVEKRIKGEYGITAMPAVWRSNKSVILKAVGASVSLFDGDKPIPKTALETVLKNKAKGTPAVTSLSVLLAAVMKARLVLFNHKTPITPQQRLVFETSIEEMKRLLREIPDA